MSIQRFRVALQTSQFVDDCLLDLARSPLNGSSEAPSGLVRAIGAMRIAEAEAEGEAQATMPEFLSGLRLEERSRAEQTLFRRICTSLLRNGTREQVARFLCLIGPGYMAVCLSEKLARLEDPNRKALD